MEPPPCIQNAMLTKDKKPFTYTPGGLNLSEIRSPRMARRIERNAAYEGVGTPPPQTNKNPISPGSLPPSTLAAMQPQMHVQVFPSGPPPPPPMHQHHHHQSRGGGAPPPPPPPQASTTFAPPPPPMQPLPTQKVRTADQQLVERPDMTKIIPDNPMALLKKTGGPRIKNTLLEEMYRSPEAAAQAQMVNINQQQRSPPVMSNQQRSPPALANQHHQQDNLRWQQQPQRSPPASPQKDIQREVYNIPQEMQPQQPHKNVNVGSIYIPPLNKQTANVSSPPVQSPKPQSPGTPTLKEAPRPWQQKHQKQGEDTPEWARKTTNNSPSSPFGEEPQREITVVTQQQQPRWPQPNQDSQPNPSQWQQQQQQRPEQLQQQQQVNQQQKMIHQDVYQNPNPWQQQQQQRPVKVQLVQQQPQQNRGQNNIQQRQQENQMNQHQGTTYPDPSNHPNAVFVTQPIILQHPGNGYGPPMINRREIRPKQDGGERIIPVRVEGSDTRSRDNNTAFGDPQEQMRKMQLNNSDQELMNRFKQVPTNNEAGPAKPQIRNIPIQIEGGNAPTAQTYVPPSQQGPAEEPKKYMGGSIPSRSFRMLQAMTSPDFCANANNEAINDYSNEHLDVPYCPGIPWTYPYPPPYPYWPPYYPPNPYELLPPSEHSCSDTELNNKNRSRGTPPSYWGYPPSIVVTDSEQPNFNSATTRSTISFPRCSSSPELEYHDVNSRRTSPKITPWGCYATTPMPGVRCNTPNNISCYWNGDRFLKTQDDTINEPGCSNNSLSYYPPYPPYFDPYYFYGFPPYYSPLPYLYSSSDSEDINNGYSSMDEMSYYNKKNHQQTTKNETTLIETDKNNSLDESSSSDTDTETGTYEAALPKRSSVPGGLQTIKSVTDINEYKNSDEESSDECSSESSNSSVYQGEEIVPHQLSVIFEVSERTEVSRNARACSVASDSTTVGMKSEDEEEDNLQTNKYWIANNLAEIASRIHSRINARIELEEEENDTDHCQIIEESLTFIRGDTNHCQQICDNLVDSTGPISKISHCHLDSETCRTKQEENEKIEDKQTKNEKREHLKQENEKKENIEQEIDESEENVEQETEKTETPKSEENEELEFEETTIVASKESSDSEDWWSVIGDKDDDYPVRKPIIYDRTAIIEETHEDNNEEIVNKDSKNGNIDREATVISYNEQNIINTNEIETKNDEEEEIVEGITETKNLVKKNGEDLCVKEEHDHVLAVINYWEKDGPILGTKSAFSSEDRGSSKEVPKAHTKESSSKLEDAESTEETYQEVYEEFTFQVPFISNNKKKTSEGSLSIKPTTKVVESTEEKQEEITCEKLELEKTTIDENSNEEPITTDDESSSESEDSKAVEDITVEPNETTTNEVETLQVPTIKERIKALQESVNAKKKVTKKTTEEENTKTKLVTEEVTVESPRSRMASAKSSVKSFDEISEEDSGVTDMSKHLSDNEEFPELRKMNKYQRASTHSRLFQLLQEECDDEEPNLEEKKNQFTLPLSQYNASDNDRLANELIESMLLQKKGQIFRNMSMDKLHAAAKKALLEENNEVDNNTPSEGFSEFLSPLRNDTGNSTPQEFYGQDYKQYYDSWAQASPYDFIPSKTFKMIQDGKLRRDNNLFISSAKCPRVLSSKNVLKMSTTPTETQKNETDGDISTGSIS